ncbi:MAG: hypothetical protein KOO62_01210 [candidate division Zixibacteria bacterium]|nr:hypothetical protein [candidate division Zixibacteria bacterium]
MAHYLILDFMVLRAGFPLGGLSVSHNQLAVGAEIMAGETSGSCLQMPQQKLDWKSV